MASTFDLAFTESTHLTNAHPVYIYKVGGDTIGQRDEGDRVNRIKQNGRVATFGEDLHADMPKTYDQVAALALRVLPIPAGAGQ
ncbi:hypothetical protein [Psychromicrobium sp. YIM B11713]|uniref:hypothetical protein n=1 Tax=Psychromicrobium sp. YIM B11713 TaxID=3145233 RepID=UPI00374F8EDC